MLKIEIPNRKPIAAEHLVLDYNGTLASDGKLIDGVRELLKDISQNLKIHVITADTFGTVTSNFANTNIEVKIIGDKDQGNQKEELICSLGTQSVVAIGNGANDAKMLKSAALGIAVIQVEGASVQTLENSDIVCTNINDALGLLLNTKRIEATLRI